MAEYYRKNNQAIKTNWFFLKKELMLNYARALVKKKFNFNLDKILKKSVLLKSIKQQAKLSKFI